MVLLYVGAYVLSFCIQSILSDQNTAAFQTQDYRVKKNRKLCHTTESQDYQQDFQELIS